MQMRIVVDETDIADAVEAHPGFERRDHAFGQPLAGWRAIVRQSTRSAS
jgi:hypothetical protein